MGKYEGVSVYESSKLGYGFNSGGVALPGRGIIVGQGAFSKGLDPDLLMHEFGHILQARQIGNFNFYSKLAPSSLRSARMNGINGHNHMNNWTESWANYKAVNYFGRGFNSLQYISKDISASRLRWLLGTSYEALQGF